MDEQRRTNLLLEAIEAKFKAILEYVKDIPQIKQDVGELKGHAERTNQRLTSIEQVVKQHSGLLQDHERRLTKLES